MFEELIDSLFVLPKDPDDGKAGNSRHLRSVRVKLPLAERDKPYTPHHREEDREDGKP
jgi:hypothetical protein